MAPESALRLVDENQGNLEDNLHSERYKIGRVLGRGTWGVVYSATDLLTDEEVAIKVLEPNETAQEQMRHRNLDVNRVMMNEALKLSACAHVVPRIFDKDKEGIPFIRMPVYRSFLSDALSEDNGRLCYDKGLNLDRVIAYAKDIALGLDEIHSKFGRAHGDIKPDNLAIDEDGNVLINDLGTSTCSSLGKSGSPRDNIGFLYTRAPECFNDDGCPRKSSDSWAFGSLLYRLLTGKYVFEDELNNAKDPVVYMTQLDSKIADIMVKKKVNKNVPREFRKFLRKCLAHDAFRRPYGGQSLVSGLEKVVRKFDRWGLAKKTLKLGSLITVPVALLSLSIYGAAVHEPMELTLPKPEMRGMLYPKPPREDEIVEFDVEDMPFEKRLPLTGFVGGQERMAKLCTDNRVVAYLTKAYGQAMTTTRGIGGSSPYTDHQFKVYMAYTHHDERRGLETRSGQMWPLFAKSIEVGLSESKTKDGKVDLEDVMTITRLGSAVVSHAKRVSGSEDYEKYREAKNRDGELIIPEKEQEFIQEWLNYFHSDA